MALAAAVASAGVVLALSASREGPAPSPSPSASATVTADASAAPAPPPPPPEPAYQPDLSGPDAGTVVVAKAALAPGIAVVGERLVWLLTERAALGSARLDGRDVVDLFAADDADAFGGSLAADASGAYWVVKSGGDDAEPILHLAATDLGHAGAKPATVTRGGSPDNLAVREGVLHFSDLGRVQRWKGGDEAETVSERDRRIAGLAPTKAGVAWLDAPYEGTGATTVMLLGGKGAPREIAQVKSADATLAAADERLFWYDEAPPAIHVGSGIEKPSRLVLTGVVSAMLVADAELYWAEAHPLDGGTVTLLRRMPVAGGDAERLGRQAGNVTALAAAGGALFWSGERGVSRLDLSR
jgi:hypothetical protein